MEKQSNKLLIPLAIIIAGSLIVWGIISTQKSPENPIVSSPNQTSTTTDPITVKTTDYILGNPDADLIFINFSDFECAFCKIFHQTMHQIIDDYGKNGQVAWIFRQFPIYGTNSEKKSAAARCAGQLGGNSKFWEMSNKIFQTDFSKEENFITEQLSELARRIDLPEKDFLKCLDDKATLELIKQEYQNGIDTGILGTSGNSGGTPYTIIVTKLGKTYPIEGAQPYNVLKSIIDIILQNQ